MSLQKILSLILLCLNGIYAQVPQLKLLGHWRDSSILGSIQYNNAFNEAYGFTSNNHEYGIIGSTYGWHIIDVTDPTKPFERMRIKGRTSNLSVIHRDFKFYKCYIYAVCDQGTESTLQVLDVSRLPDTASLVYDDRSLFHRSHTIHIDENKARLYTNSEKNDAGIFALGVYDISVPDKPKFLGHFNRFGNILANHVHDCFVRNDTAYLNCGYDGFAIMDFSDITNPKPLFTLRPNEYQYSGYNHSGWLSPDGKTYVMADENHGSPLKVMDFSDWNKIAITSLLWANKDTSKSVPHNPRLSCKYAYVSYYYDGLQVYNVEDIKKPKLVGYYPTSSEVNDLSYEGAWGVYPFLPSGNIIVADMQNGMFIIEGPEKTCNVNNQCSVTGTKEDNMHKLEISPNPSHGVFIVKNLSNGRSIEIMNSMGQLIYQENIHSRSQLELNLSAQCPGIYFVKLLFENGHAITSKIFRS